jgi:glycosyltransferase involved in cell wall biosynthesis
MKEYLVKEYYLDPDKIAVISHGVDRAKKIKDAKIVPGSIMFFGHLRPMKGIENLLQAFRLLLNMNQNAKLLIVGSPHAHDKSGYLANLRHLVQQQGLDDRVRLESFVSEEELTGLISTSQIIVFPYLDDGFIEASGAIARMMDYGKPVVCTNIPKFKGEFYDQSRCIMIEKENAATLAEKLNSLIRDAHLREEKAKCLKEVAQTRYWNIVAKRHIELYKSCLLKKLND